MTPNRRDMLRTIAGACMASQSLPSSAETTAGGIEAVLFDAFAIFDPRPIGDLAKRLIGDRSAVLMSLWRRKQFEYSWLRTCGGRYESFWQVTRDALDFAADDLGLDHNAMDRALLMNAFLDLKAWPDVESGLKNLRAHGLRLGLLSNFSETMLQAVVANLNDFAFDVVLSTDPARRFKPDPRAYEIGATSLRLSRDRILFVAFAGWDAAGATWFGYETYWLNRLDAPPEQLGVAIGSVGRTFDDLVHFVTRR